MSILSSAINRQMDLFIREHPLVASKIRMVFESESIRKIAIIVAITAPVFALFLPYIFNVVSWLSIGIVSYDIFSFYTRQK